MAFNYKILIVDDAYSPKQFNLKSGKTIPATPIPEIDGALELLGVPTAHLDQTIVKHNVKPKHDYDIVLLDFQMRENKLVISKDSAGKEQTSIASYEYPMGAVSLQPLFLMGFANSGKLGNCIVQPFSRFIWERCPKAAAVTYIAQNMLSNYPMKSIHDGSHTSLDIEGLIRDRASSIIAALPFSALNDLRELLDCNLANFFYTNLPNVAQALGEKNIYMSELRPDCNESDSAKLLEWLRTMLMGRGYAYEAHKCWENLCVNTVSHGGALRTDLRPIQPWEWPNDEMSAVEIKEPSGTFYVCPELLSDLKNFNNAYLYNGTARSKILHELFRLDLSKNATGQSGYRINDCLSELDAAFLDQASSPGCYVYIHKSCLKNILNGMRNLALAYQNSEQVNQILVYADKQFPYAYFIVKQRDVIDFQAASNIKIGLGREEKWNGLGNNINLWGGLEIWSQNNSWSVSKNHLTVLDESDSPYNKYNLLGALDNSLSQIVFVVPKVKKE